MGLMSLDMLITIPTGALIKRNFAWPRDSNDVEVIERHQKGGYRMRFELSPEGIEDFIAYLNRHDWMSVI